MKRCSVVILASKKCNTLNISGLEFLDFPGILRQNDKTPRLFLTWNAICQIWWLLLDTRTTGNYVMSQDDKFSLQFENQVILWMKIVTWYTFPNFLHEIPWYFPDVCPFSKFPWHFFKFPDNSLTLKKSFFPLLFPDLWQPWKCACQFFLRETGRVKLNCARPASSATRGDNEVDHAVCLQAEFQMHTVLFNENDKFYTTMIYPSAGRYVFRWDRLLDEDLAFVQAGVLSCPDDVTLRSCTREFQMWRRRCKHIDHDM